VRRLPIRLQPRFEGPEARSALLPSTAILWPRLAAWFDIINRGSRLPNLSLRLTTPAKDRPLSFLDHQLRLGNVALRGEAAVFGDPGVDLGEELFLGQRGSGVAALAGSPAKRQQLCNL
jgi:hypothetical protein